MDKENINDVKEESEKSPKGKFEIHRKHLKPSLGGKFDSGIWDNGHPFDVELSRVPPGKRNWPFHAHAATWEYYIVISGSGIFRLEEKKERIEEGDHVICPPGEAHQIINDGTADLVYYVIATNPQADVITYPDSGKKMIVPEFLCFEPKGEFYYKNEE